MSNKEMKDGLQEDTSGVSDENTGIEEEINATMDKHSSTRKRTKMRWMILEIMMILQRKNQIHSR